MILGVGFLVSTVGRLRPTVLGPSFLGLCYGLLVIGTGLLVYDTGGLDSTYLFLWSLVILASGFASTGALLFSLLVSLAYFTVIALKLPDEPLMLTIVIAVGLPVLIGALLRRGIIISSQKKYERASSDYKKQSSQITRLIDESSGIIRSLGDGAIVIDSQEIIRLVNPAAEKLIGWSAEDAITLQYESVLRLANDSGEALDNSLEPIKQCLNTNQESRVKSLQVTTKNDKKLYIAATVSPLGESGSGVIAIIRDITKDRAEEQEQAEFISTASHEMRTPVASIEGYLGLALNPSTAQVDDKARDYIGKAQESAKHLGRLFQDLLDVSKSEDGRLSNNPRVFDVVDYVGVVIEGMQSLADKKNLNLIYRPAPSTESKTERRLSPVIYGNLDQSHVRELVSNLTENAIKYTLNGEVAINVTGDDKTVTISVADSGIGIPDEDMSHLFQKFYRVDSTDTREIGGTGLGLFLCRRLAETMGGKIWAESTYGKGSTFFVELPRLDAPSAKRLLAEQKRKEEESRPQPIESTASTNSNQPSSAEAAKSSAPISPVQQPRPRTTQQAPTQTSVAAKPSPSPVVASQSPAQAVNAQTPAPPTPPTTARPARPIPPALPVQLATPQPAQPSSPSTPAAPVASAPKHTPSSPAGPTPPAGSAVTTQPASIPAGQAPNPPVTTPPLPVQQPHPTAQGSTTTYQPAVSGQATQKDATPEDTNRG